jgi:hypothetical protein
MLWECAICEYQFEDDWAVCPECSSTECYTLEDDSWPELHEPPEDDLWLSEDDDGDS